MVQETGAYSTEVASEIDQQVSKDGPSAIATARTTFVIGASSNSGSSWRSNYGSSSRSNSRSIPRSRFSVSSSASHIASLRAPPKKRKYRKIRSLLKAIKEYWKPTPNPPRYPVQTRSIWLSEPPLALRPDPVQKRQRKRTRILRAIKEYWKPSDNPVPSWARAPAVPPPPTRASVRPPAPVQRKQKKKRSVLKAIHDYWRPPPP